MATWQLLVLALIQGFTEFLPISSSAHLILPSQVFAWPDQGLAFDVAVHVGSLLAVVLYFAKDIGSILKHWFSSLLKRPHVESEAVLGWAVIIGTIPAGLAGLVFDAYIELYLRSLWVIATTTIVFGLLLWYADWWADRAKLDEAVGIKKAIIIGFAQAIALIPGTSRSGITMTAGLLVGLSKQKAARFSFLLSIPLIAVAGLLKVVELASQEAAVAWREIGVGTLLSFLSAWLCIYFFLKLIERMGFLPFVIYRLLLGLFLFGVGFGFWLS